MMGTSISLSLSAFIVLFVIRFAFCLQNLLSTSSSSGTIIALKSNDDVKFGSEALYDNETAIWTFNLRLRIPQWNVSSTGQFIRPTLLFRVELETLAVIQQDENDHHPSDDWLPNDQRLLQRFQYTGYYLQDRKKDDEVNVTIAFDHAYTGHYKTRIYSCTNWNTCPAMIYESDLGLVETDLLSIDVHRMNMTFQTCSRGTGSNAVLEFRVDYNDDGNGTEGMINPFKDFVVELSAGPSKEDFKVRTHLNRIAVNNCSSSSSSTSCIQNVPAGNYTISVTPIDSRCNTRDVNAYLELIPASMSPHIGLCKRTSADNFLEITGDDDETFHGEEIADGHMESIVIGTKSTLLTILIVGLLGILICYIRFRKKRYGRLTFYRIAFHQSSDDDEIGTPLSTLTTRAK